MRSKDRRQLNQAMNAGMQDLRTFEQVVADGDLGMDYWTGHEWKPLTIGAPISDSSAENLDRIENQLRREQHHAAEWYQVLAMQMHAHLVKLAEHAQHIAGNIKGGSPSCLAQALLEARALHSMIVSILHVNSQLKPDLFTVTGLRVRPGAHVPSVLSNHPSPPPPTQGNPT